MWPLVMSHAVHLHNHTLHPSDGLCPIEIWTKSKNNYTHLTNAHTWGCPVYVLDPALQDGQKIPCWDPRSRRGVYLGISPLHASTVGLIYNSKTNRISPQFHCVYDDYFQTVHSNDPNHPPPIWDDLIINSRFRNDFEDGIELEDTWNKPVPSTPTDPLTQSRPVGPDTGDCAPSPMPARDELTNIPLPTPDPKLPPSDGDKGLADSGETPVDAPETASLPKL